MAKRTKPNRKPYLGNKYRLNSLEAKNLAQQLGQQLQLVTGWVLALDRRLRALEPVQAPIEPDPATQIGPSEQSPPVEAPIEPQEVPGNG